MAKQLLNEAERFLLERWEEAHLLEEAMKGVRTKYKEVFERIAESVKEAHSELDANVAYLTQSGTTGQIGFGRRVWPDGESKEPSGFWICNLRLEMLAAKESETPFACIWVPKKAKLDLDAAQLALKEAAVGLLTPEERKSAVAEESDEVLLWWPAPSKAVLLGSFADGDGQKFVELFVSQFDMMARFVPVLDQLFREHLRTE